MLRNAHRRAVPPPLLGFGKPTDPALDRLARLATQVLHTPIALVVSVGADRQDVIGCAERSASEAAIRESPLLHAFCASVVAKAQPLIVGDTRAQPLRHDQHLIDDAGMLAYAGMPLTTTDGNPCGVFCVIDAVPRHWTVDEIDTLRALTPLVSEELDRQATVRILAAQEQASRTSTALLLHEVQSGHDRLQTLSTQLLHAQEAERRAIARELHDEIGQDLTVIQMNLQELLSVDPARLPEHIEDSIATVERVLAQVRAMALDLRPSQLDDLGLAEALRWYLTRHAAHGHLKISFDLPALTPRPPADVETTCFRIAQEAMTNILRSAHATHVWLTVGVDAEALTLSVRDDGRGFDVAAGRARAVQGSSLGLLSMEERAALIGGRTTIESTPGAGTTVRAWLPLRALDATGAP